MATIYAIVGEYNLAIDELEIVLPMPSWVSPKYLRADPIFAPLQDMPRFKKLLADIEKQNNL